MGTFATRLGDTLERLGLKQVEAADRIGIPQGTLSRYLRGQTTPSVDVGAQIASALGVSLDDLAVSQATGTKSFPCSEELSDPWQGWAKRLQAAYRREPDVVASGIRAAWGKETAEQIIEWLNKEKPPLG